MKYSLFVTLAALIMAILGCRKSAVNKYYKGNPEPLLRNAYIKLPLGAVKPEGWLRSQLEAQAAGLTGNLDDFWPDLVNSSWRGGDGEAWERGPYYLDGLIPLAYLLNDQRLIEKSGARRDFGHSRGKTRLIRPFLAARARFCAPQQGSQAGNIV